MLIRSTAAEVGGAVALALNVTVWRVMMLGVAVMLCRLWDPTLSDALATPVASVVLWAGPTPPPPDATLQFTTTPGTPRLVASSAVTLSSVGSGLLKYQPCPSPPPLTPPHAASHSAPPKAVIRRARFIGSSVS